MPRTSATRTLRNPKGTRSNLVGYSQRDLAVPLLTEAAVAGTTVDAHTANAVAKVWCAEVKRAGAFGDLRDPRRDARLRTKLLAPLPSLRLQIGPPPETRKVDRLSCVRFASARYPVPNRLIGARVTLVQTDGRLVIVDPDGVVVAEHDLAAPGTAPVLDEHYDGPRPAPNRGPRPRSTVEHQFCDLGESAEAFLVGAAAIGNTRLGSELRVLLALGAARGTPEVVVEHLVRCRGQPSAIAEAKYLRIVLRSIYRAFWRSRPLWTLRSFPRWPRRSTTS